MQLRRTSRSTASRPSPIGLSWCPISRLTSGNAKNGACGSTWCSEWYGMFQHSRRIGRLALVERVLVRTSVPSSQPLCSAMRQARCSGSPIMRGSSQYTSGAKLPNQIATLATPA